MQAKRQEFKQQLKQPPLKKPATDTGETSGIQTTVEAATSEEAATDPGETSGIQTTVEAATSEDAKRQELKQQLKQPPLKMPATDTGEKSGTHNLRPRPTSPEDTMYIHKKMF